MAAASPAGLGLAAAVCVLASVASGCREDRPPATLVDGSRARLAPGSFEGVSVPVIATRVRTRPERPRCGPIAARRRVVEHTGVVGRSVTVLTRGGTIHGCDSTDVDATCGHAFARVRSRRPLDPRLSLTCRDRTGRPIAFAWIVPAPGAVSVVIASEHHAEAYPVVSALPVRVASQDVALAAASARFVVTEHAGNGSLVRGYELEAQVSG